MLHIQGDGTRGTYPHSDQTNRKNVENWKFEIKNIFDLRCQLAPQALNFLVRSFLSKIYIFGE